MVRNAALFEFFHKSCDLFDSEERDQKCSEIHDAFSSLIRLFQNGVTTFFLKNLSILLLFLLRSLLGANQSLLFSCRLLLKENQTFFQWSADFLTSSRERNISSRKRGVQKIGNEITTFDLGKGNHFWLDSRNRCSTVFSKLEKS